MPSITDIVDRSMLLATNTANDSNRSLVVDNEATAFAAVPHAVRSVMRRFAALGICTDDMQREHSIEIGQKQLYRNDTGPSTGLTNTYGTLPDTVLREFLKRARLPRVDFASEIPYEDFNRYRFDEQLKYFSIRDPKVYYSSEVGLQRTVELETGAGSVASDTIVIGTDEEFSSDDANRRIRVVKTSDGTVFVDAFIASVSDGDTLVLNGRPLSWSADVDVTVSIFDELDYTTSRALTNVNTTAGSRTVTCAGGAFTSADVGRRLPVVQSVVKIDSIIAKINSGTSVEMYAKATGNTTTGTANVQYCPLILDAPGIPDISGDPDEDLDLSPAVLDETIVVVAAVVKGEMSLEKLLATAGLAQSR